MQSRAVLRTAGQLSGTQAIADVRTGVPRWGCFRSLRSYQHFKVYYCTGREKRFERLRPIITIV